MAGRLPMNAGPAANLTCGSVLGDFRLETLIAEGGMGRIYTARQLSLDRVVALKVVCPQPPAATLTHRLRREARIVLALEHPHIVPVYTVGESEGVFFIAMRLIVGATLVEMVQAEGPL